MKLVLYIHQIEDLKKATSAVQAMMKTSKNIILLNGDLGAGKTTFVVEFCKLYQLHASSPTFSLIQDYHNENIKISHVDLYRLNNDSEIDSSGFWDLFSHDYNVIFIEWSVKLNENDLPVDWTILNLNFRKTGESQREITITKQLFR